MCSARMSRKSLAPNKPFSRIESTRMTEVLFQRFKAGGVIPKLLQNVVQSSQKLSTGQTKADTVQQDGIVLEQVRLGVGQRRHDNHSGNSVDPVAAVDQQCAASDACDIMQVNDGTELLVQDKRWFDNCMSLGHGFPLEKLKAIAAGPGGAYQLMYRIYCSLATLSLVLFVSCLIAFTVIVVLVVPICGRTKSDRPAPKVALNPAPPPLPAKSRRQAVFVLGIVASACGMASILLIFSALLVKAWSVYQFGCLQLPEPKSAESVQKPVELPGKYSATDVDTFSEAAWS